MVAAYQSVLYAQREIDVAQHEQETASALLASVDDHVKAGLAVESDRMSAQVNVAARKQELIAAQGDLDLAWAQLREAMGVPDLKASELKPIEPHTFDQLPLEQELATAAKTRPDLTALTQAQSAQAVGPEGGEVELRPCREHLRQLGRRPRIAGQFGWKQLGGRRSDQCRHSADLGKRAQLAQQTAAKQKIDAQLSASQQHVRLGSEPGAHSSEDGGTLA